MPFYTEDDVLRIAATYLELWLDEAEAAGVGDWVRAGLYGRRKDDYAPLCADALASTVERAVRIYGRNLTVFLGNDNRVQVVGRIVIEPREAAALMEAR